MYYIDSGLIYEYLWLHVAYVIQFQENMLTTGNLQSNDDIGKERLRDSDDLGASLRQKLVRFIIF